MKINGRKMFVFIYLATTGFIATMFYMIAQWSMKMSIDWRVPVGFFAYMIIDSFIVISANTAEKYIRLVLAWKGGKNENP